MQKLRGPDKALTIDSLKATAEELGLVPYASLYGDKRCKGTWERLLADSELQPLQQRQSEQSEAQINWQFLIASFFGAVVLVCLFKPVMDKILPVKITIQIGAK